MPKAGNSRGFTLIEMLVVIAIIATLAAILFPVIGSAREKARQAQCRTNLMQLVQQLKVYRTDYGMYPPPPVYNGTRYEGGFSALYPDYIQDRNLLICPDDHDVRVLRNEATQRVYSSYNGIAVHPAPDSDASADWTISDGLYNQWGYTYTTVADGDGYSDGFAVAYANRLYPPGSVPVPAWMDTNSDGLPDWLAYHGLRWQHFPCLANNHAPDTTVVTHCPHHRFFYDEGREQDMVVRLNGQSAAVEISLLEAPDDSEVAPWVHQSF